MQPSRRLSSALIGLALLLGGPARAGEGLMPTDNDWLWPQVQARLVLQTASLTPVSLARAGADPAATNRGIFGAALFGDYVFATPGFGNLRATSGLLLGAQGGAPLWQQAGLPRLSVNAMDLGGLPVAGSLESAPASPYLGLGISSPIGWRSWSLTADIGWVAGRPSGVAGFGRALLGNGPLEAAWREMRLSPVVQMSMRYSF